MSNPEEVPLIPLVLAHPSGRDRDALVAFLERGGHDVEVVRDADALADVLGSAEAPRAVVLDVSVLGDHGAVPALGSVPVLVLGDLRGRSVPAHWHRLPVPYYVEDLAAALDGLNDTTTPARPDPAPPGPTPTVTPSPVAVEGGPVQRDLLLRSLAHALNNPLASALGWVQLLEAQIGNEGPQERALAQIHHELRRLEKISNALATIGQRPGGPDGSVDFAAMVQARVAILEAEGIVLSLALPPAPAPLVRGDSRDLGLMLDLLSEALLEERSRIESVELHLDVQPATLGVTLREIGNTLPAGIELDDIGVLLNFLRPTRALALAVAHAVVQRRLGGRMQVGRDPAGAAWLKLILPRAENASEAEAT